MANTPEEKTEARPPTDSPAITSASVAGNRAESASSDRSSADAVSEGVTLKGKYLLERKIGEGGMGLIFQARDLEEERISREHGVETRRYLAIKVLQPKLRAYGSAILQEVRRTRGLVHENIVRVGDCQQDGELLFMTMEFLEGKTLDALLDQDFAQGVHWNLAQTVIEGMCRGLAYAHDHGVVHCDFKPANVFITLSFSPKILDFGIARAVRGQPSEFGQPSGLTTRYASPEMMRAWQKNGMTDYRPDPRDDVFALAFVVYETLTGRHPLGEDFEDAEQARQQQFNLPTVHGVSARQNDALGRAMAFDRAQRTPKIEQFLHEFLPDREQGRAGKTVQGNKTVQPTLIRIGLWVAAFVAVLTGGLLLWAHFSSSTILRPGAQPVSAAGEQIPWQQAKQLAAKLGIESSLPSQSEFIGKEALRKVLRTSPRRVKLGSTGAEIQTAFALCQKYAPDCTLNLYVDEQAREGTLAPFALDALLVAVQDFSRFIEETGYRTAAELSGAYRYEPRGVALEGFASAKRGNWRNGVTFARASDDWPVVGVNFEDAQAYCQWKGRRLPTEDEWEYATRGPDRHIFGWGDDVERLPPRNTPVPPAVGSGPMEGIGGRYRNLSGVVWQWTDTDAPAAGSAHGKIRKGGAWRDSNLANNWAAMRRYSERSWADDISGFRCALTIPQWSDADLWLRAQE